MASVTVPFSLDPEKHGHILEWLGQQENVSLAIREVLDEHVRGSVRLADVYRELRDVRQAMVRLERRGVTVVTDGAGAAESATGDEPEIATTALDAMGRG